MAASRFEPDIGIFKQPLHHADRPVLVPAAINAEGIRIAAHYVTPMYWDTWLRQRASYGKPQYPWSGAGKRRITYEGSCPEAERAYADHMTLYCHKGFDDDYIQDITAAPAKV
jgi:dTDP-4-amino-4,6-dideoxygalactose transaminase